MARRDKPVVVSSSADDFVQSVNTLIESIEPPPVLLLDGLDESLNPFRILRLIRAIARNTNAKIVVTSQSHLRSRLFSKPEEYGFIHFLKLESFTDSETIEFLNRHWVDRPPEIDITQLARQTGGNPLALSILPSLMREIDIEALTDYSESGLLTALVSKTLRREILRQKGGVDESNLLHTLGLLALRGAISTKEVENLLGNASYLERLSLVREDGEGIVRLVHTALSLPLFVLAGAIPPPGTTLRDLEFGAEEAERDSLLDANFLEPAQIQDLRRGLKTIVIGDRGSGKSALFQSLVTNNTAFPESHQALSIRNPTEFLESLEADCCQLYNSRAVPCSVATCGWVQLGEPS